MDNVNKKTCPKIMATIKGVSKMEVLPKSMSGFYLRQQPSGIYGKPDFANKSRKIAILMHGCFWHYPCPLQCSKVPKTNAGFWRDKFRHNNIQHKKVVKRLKASGWTTITILEHKLKGTR